MGSLSALLVLCEEVLQVIGGFFSQITSDVEPWLFLVSPTKLLNKPSGGRWCEASLRTDYFTVLINTHVHGNLPCCEKTSEMHTERNQKMIKGKTWLFPMIAMRQRQPEAWNLVSWLCGFTTTGDLIMLLNTASQTVLMHWDRDKMATILQTTFSWISNCWVSNKISLNYVL